jgi:hypothetical protein
MIIRREEVVEIGLVFLVLSRGGQCGLGFLLLFLCLACDRCWILSLNDE